MSHKDSNEPQPSTSKRKLQLRPALPPELDIRSELFDPLKALYSDEIYIPVRNARIYDNIGKYESEMNRPKGDGKKSSPRKRATTSSVDGAKKNPFEQAGSSGVRRFLPHQGLYINVFTYIQEI